MTSTLDTLRDALLLTLIVILMYILYKRLLRVMGKDKVNRKRLTEVDGSGLLSNGVLMIRFEIPTKSVIEISVAKQEGNTEISNRTSSYDEGVHEVQLDMKELERGMTYFYTIKSDDQVIMKRLVQ